MLVTFEKIETVTMYGKMPLQLTNSLRLLTLLVLNIGWVRLDSAVVHTTREVVNLLESPSCHVFCHGDLLRTVQMAHIFNDSKSFVDMKLRYAPEKTLEDFQAFMDRNVNKPSKDEIKEFVEDYFEDRGKEFVPWTPDDWKEEPAFLNEINDPDLRQWGVELNALWKELGRKMIDDVHENPNHYSIIPVDNPVIVPGGRFTEFYYWDSYWVIRGLLYCEMTQTARGMLENFMSMIRRFGYIPNGGRVYYAGRSQPPLLAAMIDSYLDFTGDTEFAVNSLDVLIEEFDYWMKNHTVWVKNYSVFTYGNSAPGPRPESYREDVETAAAFSTDEEKEELYNELKAAAESGMDFSSRWFMNANGERFCNLTDLKTRSIVPVELNSILYWYAQIIAKFAALAGDKVTYRKYKRRSLYISRAIHAVHWNQDAGVWFDYDLLNNKPREYFAPTNLAPLWTKAYNPRLSKKIALSVLRYLTEVDVDKYPGGIPNSIYASGQQWDFPNAWPPMQYLIVEGLYNLGSIEATKLSEKWGHRWVLSNYKAYTDKKAMFEKYDARTFGGTGGGGEYEVQTGFGWTNGIIIEYLYTYGPSISVRNNDVVSDFD